MRDVMYDIPSNPHITKCLITKETVINKKEPIVTIDENKKHERQKMKKKIGKSNQETA